MPCWASGDQEEIQPGAGHMEVEHVRHGLSLGPASGGAKLLGYSVIKACPLHQGLGSPQNLSISSTCRRREGLEMTGGTNQAQGV